MRRRPTRSGDGPAHVLRGHRPEPLVAPGAVTAAPSLSHLFSSHSADRRRAPSAQRRACHAPPRTLNGRRASRGARPPCPMPGSGAGPHPRSRIATGAGGRRGKEEGRGAAREKGQGKEEGRGSEREKGPARPAHPRLVEQTAARCGVRREQPYRHRSHLAGAHAVEVVIIIIGDRDGRGGGRLGRGRRVRRRRSDRLPNWLRHGGPESPRSWYFQLAWEFRWSPGVGGVFELQ